MRWSPLLWALVGGCGLFESPEELRKGPAPVVEGPVTVDAAAQERARAAAKTVAEAGRAAGSAEACPAAVAAASATASGAQGVKAGGFVAGGAGAEETPLWAQAWTLEHAAGTAEGLDEVVETTEGRFAHVVVPVEGCGVVWVEAPVATGE